MTIHDCLVRLDNSKYNDFSDFEKIAWLSLLEGRVYHEVLNTQEGGPEEYFIGYCEDTDRDTPLLASGPYEDIYLRYLETEIDYCNGEIEKYNNSSTLFQAAWAAFVNHYNRTHMPLGKPWNFG